MKIRTVIVGTLVVLLMPLASSAQDAKIADLETRVRALEQVNVNRGASVASAVSRAEAIQTEFAAVKGAVDSNTHVINGVNNQMQSLYRELERRIQVLEDQLRLIQDMLKKSAGSGAPRATEEYLAYQSAVEKMTSSEYLRAAADFQDFIRNHPKSELIGSAQFQIGECYYQDGDYQQAIKQFQIFIERNPRNPKVADALVRQGAAFVELNMIEEAKAFLTKVMRDYPQSSAANQAKAKMQLLEGRGVTTASNHQVSTPPQVDLAYPSETIQQQRAREKVQQPVSPTPQKKRNLEF